jgi:hypothetical protein
MLISSNIMGGDKGCHNGHLPPFPGMELLKSSKLEKKEEN